MAIDAPTQPAPNPTHESGRSRRRGGGWGKVIVLLLFGAGAVAVAYNLPRSGLPDRELAIPETHTVGPSDLEVTVTESGTLESADNTEIKCQVRGQNTITWVVESGTIVKKGEKLLQLDTLLIQEEIDRRTKLAQAARSVAERSRADVARAKIAIREYENGRFPSQLMSQEKDRAIAESNLLTAQNMLSHAKMMKESGYVSDLEVTEKQFAVDRARLNLDVTKNSISVLKQFTKREELATLDGNLAASQSRHDADLERSKADARRLEVAEEEFQQCVVRAEKDGIVIYPTAEEWKRAPEIEEGANVHKNQTLLLMPDLLKMQVKIGIHESIVNRVRKGISARVTLRGETLVGSVSAVSAAARPAGWWNGNAVKYNTIVRLPEVENLRPGMTAEVEVVLAQYQDVLTVPVSAVLETEQDFVCWVKAGDGVERRVLQLGDTNYSEVIVDSGLKAGDSVITNPLDSVAEAQDALARTLNRSLRLRDEAAKERSRVRAQLQRPQPAPNPGEFPPGGESAKGKQD